jgi:hypothetical protein
MKISNVLLLSAETKGSKDVHGPAAVTRTCVFAAVVVDGLAAFLEDRELALRVLQGDGRQVTGDLESAVRFQRQSFIIIDLLPGYM